MILNVMIHIMPRWNTGIRIEKWSLAEFKYGLKMKFQCDNRRTWKDNCAAFDDAANQTDGEVITLLQLMKSMFELGFLDVSDMRWRTPTKTFWKEGG